MRFSDGTDDQVGLRHIAGIGLGTIRRVGHHFDREGGVDVLRVQTV